jgi:hypothetical protein
VNSATKRLRLGEREVGLTSSSPRFPSSSSLNRVMHGFRGGLLHEGAGVHLHGGSVATPARGIYGHRSMMGEDER